jgi:hypothetical protein
MFNSSCIIAGCMQEGLGRGGEDGGWIRACVRVYQQLITSLLGVRTYGIDDWCKRKECLNK